MCGHWFTPSDHKRLYCSWECREASKLAKYRAKYPNYVYPQKAYS